MPGLAIVICSRNRPQFLDGALEAIRAVKRPGDEAIFVDSASTDPAVQAVAASYPDFTVVRCEQPGLARARNRGIGAATASVVAFTDDDCRPQAGWPEALLGMFDADPRVGFVTGQVVPDRVGQGPLISVGGGVEPRTFEYGADPAELGHGANFAVRREAAEAVDGFDEALGVGARFAGAEDHDMFWRILRAGWIGRYDPRALVVHCQWRTRRQYLKAEYGYGLGSGAFAAKAMRLERQAGVRLLKDGLWRRGAAAAGRELRKGHETAAAANAVRFAGSVVGAVKGWRVPLDGGRYTAD